MGLGRRAAGIVCILGVVLLWVGSSELIQIIFDNPRFRFESPLFLTFYSTALFSIYLSGFFFFKSWRCSLSIGTWPPPELSDDPLGSSALPADGEGDALLDDVAREEGGGGIGGEAALPSAYSTLILGARFAPLWIAANLCFNASLCRSCGTGTSVSSNTLLSSSSGVFTLVFSILFLGDDFSWWKFLCVVMTSCGVGLLVMFDGSKAQGQNVWGDLMALAAAMFMGAYSVQLKHMLGGPQSKNISMPMFFGFLGVTAVVISIPIFLAVVLLHVTGWAHLGLIHQLNADTMGALTVNGLVGTVLSDVLWAEAVLLTSPLAVNLSICLTIPLAFLVDHLRGVVVAPPQPLYILGAVPVTFTSCMQDCMRPTHWHSRSVVWLLVRSLLICVPEHAPNTQVLVFLSFIGVNVLEYLSHRDADESELHSSRERLRALRQRRAHAQLSQDLSAVGNL